jgi:hypothetical protein
MMRKIIIVDYASAKSIKSATSRKTRLENLGYKVVGSEQIGFDRFRIIMEEIKRKK